MPLPPRDVFAAAARRAVEELHTEWDSPHSFQILCWDGANLNCRTYACLMPDIDPPKYPAMMTGLAREDHEKHPGEPAYAYLLQIECFGVTAPLPGATKDEIVQYNVDRMGRTFHQRADAVESCTAWVADIHGRLWTASKTRDKPSQINEAFYPPGKLPVGGQMINGLLAVAQATGTLSYGLPMPFSAGMN